MQKYATMLQISGDSHSASAKHVPKVVRLLNVTFSSAVPQAEPLVA